MRKSTFLPIGAVFIGAAFLAGCTPSMPESNVIDSTYSVPRQEANEKVPRVIYSFRSASPLSRECIRYHALLHNLQIRGGERSLTSSGRNELAQIRAVVSPLCLSTTPVGSPSVAREDIERGVADLQQLLSPGN
jgi:hypothetical protein